MKQNSRFQIFIWNLCYRFLRFQIRFHGNRNTNIKSNIPNLKFAKYYKVANTKLMLCFKDHLRSQGDPAETRQIPSGLRFRIIY